MGTQQPYYLDDEMSDVTESNKGRKLHDSQQQLDQERANESYQLFQHTNFENLDEGGYPRVPQAIADLFSFDDFQHTGSLDLASSPNYQGSYPGAPYPSAMVKYHSDMLAPARATSSPYGDMPPMLSGPALQPYLDSTSPSSVPNHLSIQGRGHYGGVPQGPPPALPMPPDFNPFGVLIPSHFERTYVTYDPLSQVDRGALGEYKPIVPQFQTGSYVAPASHTPQYQHHHPQHQDIPAAPMLLQPQRSQQLLEPQIAPVFAHPLTALLTPVTANYQPLSTHLPLPSATPLSAAAKLLNGSLTHFKVTTRLPWGFQRVKTLERLTELAAGAGIPVPSFSDDIVRAYFSSHTRMIRFNHGMKSTVPPVDVDIRLLGKLRVTAAELLTFFPLHFRWHDYMYRLIQNGWKQTDIAGYINYARRMNKTDAVRGNSLIVHQQEADEGIIRNKKQGIRSRPKFRTTCFTAEKWEVPLDKRTQRSLQLCDYFLINLADGVVHFPQNGDARLLTKSVAYAVQHGHQDVKLSEVGAYVQKHGLGAGVEPMAWRGLKNGAHPDTAAKEALWAEIETGGG